MLARMFCAALALLLGSACATAADLSIAVGADVTSIDPHYHNLTPNNNIAEHIFETLVTKDPKSLLKPALAVSWKAIDDLTWEFRLRKGVKFHDGSDFTAADVVFSIERVPHGAEQPVAVHAYTNQITEKIIVDPLTDPAQDRDALSADAQRHGHGIHRLEQGRQRCRHRRFRFRQGDHRHRAVQVRALCERRPRRARAHSTAIGAPSPRGTRSPSA